MKRQLLHFVLYASIVYLILTGDALVNQWSHNSPYLKNIFSFIIVSLVAFNWAIALMKK